MKQAYTDDQVLPYPRADPREPATHARTHAYSDGF